MKKFILLLLFACSFIVSHAKPVRFTIHLDDGCFIHVEGDYTVDFNGAHFSGTVTSGGTSPHCPTSTAILNFRSSAPNPDAIEIVCNCTDICNADKIEFTSLNSNYQSMVNYLNRMASTFLSEFKTHACN